AEVAHRASARLALILGVVEPAAELSRYAPTEQPGPLQRLLVEDDRLRRAGSGEDSLVDHTDRHGLCESVHERQSKGLPLGSQRPAHGEEAGDPGAKHAFIGPEGYGFDLASPFGSEELLDHC